MNSNNNGITKLQANDTVSLAVIIEGTFEGVSQGSTQLQNMIATYVENNDVDDFNEEWILDNVEVFPLLSTEPLHLTYDVTQELDITFDEDMDEDVSYYIDDIDTEFDSLSELEDWISESINDHDYTAEQCKSWDIEKRIKTRIEVEIEGDDEFDITAYGARRKVLDFISMPEPTPPTPPLIKMEVDYESMTGEQLLEHTDRIRAVVIGRIDSQSEEEVDYPELPTETVEEVRAYLKGIEEVEHDVEYEVHRADHVVALGHPDTIERGAKIWALSEYYASKRLAEDKPVYLIDEVGRGVRTESLEAIREYIRQGGMVGRLWNDGSE